MSIIYGLKVNLSVAMVAMLNHTAIRESADRRVVQIITEITTDDDSCKASNSTTSVDVNKFHALSISIA